MSGQKKLSKEQLYEVARIKRSFIIEKMKAFSVGNFKDTKTADAYHQMLRDKAEELRLEMKRLRIELRAKQSQPTDQETA